MAAAGRQAERSPRRVSSTWARVTLRTLRVTPVVVSVLSAPRRPTGSWTRSGSCRW